MANTASNAAAFAFELLANTLPVNPLPSLSGTSQDFYKTAATLYPQGPTQDGVWERAGGDLAAITLGGTGQSMWWSALRQLKQGGGVPSITMASLVAAMRNDYPNNEILSTLAEQA